MFVDPNFLFVFDSGMRYLRNINPRRGSVPSFRVTTSLMKGPKGALISAMTEDEYYAAVKRLGLHGTKIPTVYMTADGNPQGVPLASNRTPEQRQETIDFLKVMLGVSQED
jgi:hypothetical protein